MHTGMLAHAGWSGYYRGMEVGKLGILADSHGKNELLLRP